MTKEYRQRRALSWRRLCRHARADFQCGLPSLVFQCRRKCPMRAAVSSFQEVAMITLAHHLARIDDCARMFAALPRRREIGSRACIRQIPAPPPDVSCALCRLSMISSAASHDRGLWHVTTCMHTEKRRRAGGIIVDIATRQPRSAASDGGRDAADVEKPYRRLSIGCGAIFPKRMGYHHYVIGRAS